ncbi:putative F-box/FBD/LRR-repeat protein [Glycine max]|nr:putative F-box/FBD/LRR-repeat protein [Glycine max]
MDEGKETKGTRSKGDTEEERDRLGKLPENVLLHIMNFMETRHAVQTCVLSKRWNNLWKSLTTLTFHHFRRINVNKFVSRVLSDRDDSISLLNLCLSGLDQAESGHLIWATRYAASHNVQQLTIHLPYKFTNILNCFDPLTLSCPSLTSLELHKECCGPPLEIPKSLQLPALKSLLLEYVSFTATDNGCAEPFSTCHSLNTLVLCSLHIDAKVLFISNSNLSILNLKDLKILDTIQQKIVFSTPNLSSLTITNYLGFSHQPFSSTCNLSCLEEGTIHTTTYISYSVFIGWLQLFANVKILKLSYDTLRILKDLSNHATTRTQPPCFARLESLKVKIIPYLEMSDEEVNRAVEYFRTLLIRVAGALGWDVFRLVLVYPRKECVQRDSTDYS